MTTAAVATEIRRFVSRESGIAETLLRDDVDLFRDGILDSLMVVSLASFCEDRFRVELTGQEFSEEALRTIAALSTLIAEKMPGTEKASENMASENMAGENMVNEQQ